MSEAKGLLTTLVGEDEWSRHRTLDRLRREGIATAELPGLVAALDDDDDASRRSAARMALSTLAAPDCPAHQAAQGALRAALRSESRDLRVLAASALGEAGDSAAAPSLVASLDDADTNVVAAAADALGELGAVEALDDLARLTATDDLWLRTSAVVALGRLSDARALSALRRVVEAGGLDRPVIEALARIGDPEVLPILEIAHRTAPGEALLGAGEVLCAHPHVEAPAWVVEAARDAQHELRIRLVAQDDPATARLLGLVATSVALDTLLDLAGPPRRSEAALTGLLAAPPDARADAILERLMAAEPEDQAVLLSLLPPLVEERRIRPLVPLLGTDDPSVRAAAAEALARAPVERTMPLLAAEIDRGGVAPEVVRAMGGLGDRACASLVPLLRDGSPAVRAAAADALARCADPSVAADLKEALARETEASVRRALLLALGQVGRAEAVDTLAAAVDDPDPEVRVAAIEALGATADDRALSPLSRALRGSEWERIAALRALGGLGQAAITEVVELIGEHLASPELDVRRAAARACLSVPRALSAANVEALARDDDAWTRTWAARILAARGDTGRPLLAELAESDAAPEVRAEARRLLHREG